MNEKAPSTPAPSDFRLVDGGRPFSALTEAERLVVVEWVEGGLRPAVFQLVTALDDLATVLRGARINVRKILDGLADGAIISRPERPAPTPKSKENTEDKFKGSVPLDRDELLDLIRDLQAARDAYFGEAQKDRFARVCGPDNVPG